MHGALPYLAKPKAKSREELRIAKHRRETMTRAVMRILDCGRSSKFEYEAAARHGLRSALCLEGWRWPEADRVAASIVEEALRRLGAQRPAWWQGQPEYADTDTSRGGCAREGCGKPIPIERVSSNGVAVKYCSDFCKSNAHAARQRESGGLMDMATYLAACAARSRKTQEARAAQCDHCGRHFLTRTAGRKYCSRACFHAANAANHERPCENCGKLFKSKDTGPRAGWTRYCSKGCAAIGRRKEREPRACPSCGAIFFPKYPSDRKRFCSYPCSVRADGKQGAFMCEAI